MAGIGVVPERRAFWRGLFDRTCLCGHRRWEHVTREPGDAYFARTWRVGCLGLLPDGRCACECREYRPEAWLWWLFRQLCRARDWVRRPRS